MRPMSIRQVALALVTILQCATCVNAVSERTRLEHAPKLHPNEIPIKRRLKSSKTSSSDDPVRAQEYAPVEWTPAMAPAEWAAAYYGTEPPTREPTRKPTREPTKVPTPQPTDNIFDGSAKDGSADEATLTIPHHVVVKVSVALSRTVSPSDIQSQVAKITTKIIRSYTPFVVYMLDGSRRRELQSTTGLEYDPKYSSTSLAFHSVDASWWTYNVAYKVNGMPEEVEETSEIDDLAESAVQGSILSGLFEQLLKPVAPQALGVSLPGKELDHTIIDDASPKDPPKATGGKPTTNDEKRKRVVGIGLAVLCFAVIIALAVIVVVSQRRRRRAAEAAWTIPLGEQKNMGQIVSAEWNSGYNGEESGAPSEHGGVFTLKPTDPPGSYMFGRWDDGVDGTATAEGTDEMSALNTSLSEISIHSSSVT